MRSRMQSLSQAPGKLVQPRPPYCQPASLFPANHLSEPESPYSDALKSFPISMGAPAQRVSRLLLSSARPPLFPGPFGPRSAGAFPLGLIIRRQTRGRGKAEGGARRGATRQWPSGRKSAASGAADWLTGWRLSRPPALVLGRLARNRETPGPWRPCTAMIVSCGSSGSRWECGGCGVIAGGGGSRVRSVLFLVRRAPKSPRAFSWAQTLVVQGLECTGVKWGFLAGPFAVGSPLAGLFVWEAVSSLSR